MIEQYISELLFKYDTVILPGFGAFVLTYSPSTIHPVENKISPPAKHVSFDPSQKNNDGILANYLSEKEKVSFFDACAMILEFVEKTNNSLAEGKEIVLDKLGVLSRSLDGFSFIADTSVNYNHEAFGMEEIISAPILRDEVKVKMQEQFDNKVNSVKTRKSFPKVAVWIMIIVVVLGGATGALFIIKPAFMNDLNLSSLFKPAENKSIPVAVTRQNQNVQTDIKADMHSNDTANTDSSTVQNTPPAQKATTEKPSSGKYHIISASFRVKENAENYAQTLHQQGYDSEAIFLKEKEMYVVSYNSFATLTEANEALEKIRSTVNANAWLLNN
jgi:nucleoid DNA-binding protein